MHKQCLTKKMKKIFFMNKKNKKNFSVYSKDKENNLFRKTEYLLKIINIFFVKICRN
jgi:hypothetical protein